MLRISGESGIGHMAPPTNNRSDNDMYLNSESLMQLMRHHAIE